MRAILFGLALLFSAVVGLATTYPVSTQDPERVYDRLKTLDPNDAASVDAEEDALVKLGNANAEKRVIQMLLDDPKTAHRGVLTAVKFRLDHAGVNPRESINKWIKEKVKEANVEGPRAEPVGAEAMQQAFPENIFYTMTFRQFPIARVVAPPLEQQNVFVVGAKGDVTHIISADDLMAYFKKNATAKSKDEAEKVGGAWAALTVEFSQDSMLQFMTRSVEAKPRDGGGFEVIASVSVIPNGGNKGTIRSTLTFEKDGKLASISDERNIREGVRPMCQATKLLDADRIVRGMAKKDILVMGPACREYLLEQRAKASPELQKAIDDVWQQILDEGR